MMEQPSGLDNSQETDEFTLGYLAAWFDAEGSLTLDRRPYRHGEVGLTVGVHCSNTDFETMEYVVSLLKKWGIGCHVMKRSFKNPNHAPVMQIRILGIKRVQQFLKIVGPHLRVKQLQAHALQEFIDLRLSSPHQGHGSAYTEREWECMRKLRGMKHSSRDPQRLHAMHLPFYPVSGNKDKVKI